MIGSLLTVGILLTHLSSPDNTLKVVARPEWKKAWEVVVNGFASFLLEMCNGVVTFLFNRQLLVYVGDLGVVVYGIISNSALIVASISNGISQAVQPILATNYGAGRKSRLKETRHMGEIAVTISGILFTGIGLLLPALVTAAS